MRYAFLPSARLEFEEAIAYYRHRDDRVADLFEEEIGAVIGMICESPDRWPVLQGPIRRCLTERFPYSVLYSIEPDLVLIVAIMHGSREPGYWMERL